ESRKAEEEASLPQAPPEEYVETEGAAAETGGLRIAKPGTGAAQTQDETTPEATPAAPLPQTVVYERGQFIFNRRFFETKFSGFFGVVPRGAEKEMVIVIK